MPTSYFILLMVGKALIAFLASLISEFEKQPLIEKMFIFLVSGAPDRIHGLPGISGL
jgi:hypothetical protein